MLIKEVPSQEAVGRLLATPVVRPTGQKLLSKGHRLQPESVLQLVAQGVQSLWVLVPDEGDVEEDEVAAAVAQRICEGPVAVKAEAGGRVTLSATQRGTLRVNAQSLQQLNLSGLAVAATLPNWSFVQAGDRLATIKSRPFAITRTSFDELRASMEAEPPAISFAPIPHDPTVGVLYSDPLLASRAVELLEPAIRHRAREFGFRPLTVSCREDVDSVARSLCTLLKAAPPLILVASTDSPSGPDDAIGLAMRKIGIQLESFMAPVDPGLLLMIGYRGPTAMVAAPSCFRSPKWSVLDVVIPALMAGFPLSQSDIGALGIGGLGPSGKA